jgi:hypothetical protein
MAQQQFNSWDPTRSGLEGNMQAQPRVFAHDADRITIGALNCSDANYGVRITDVGQDFEEGEVVALTHGGLNAELTVLTVDDDVQGIVNYKIECDTVGDGYAVGDLLVGLTGDIAGTDLDVEITNIDIPKTQKRGCCLYNGSAAAQSITVVMEAAIYDGSAGTGYNGQTTFTNVPSGAFLPIEVVQLVTGASIVALY